MMSSACGREGVGGVTGVSNFAHVIFQNVGKSFLPQAALECSYTLTPFIIPHPKDWVGIFKVGWSSARDYYTFLWSPLPENYTEGSTVHTTLVFQGYYVPRSDGEFYQFCYVTHTGEIRGASTPFQFRSATPTAEDLLTVEDDGNSDILVVTTKTGLLEVQKECREMQTAEAQLGLWEESQARVKQLEQDLLEVAQRAELRETELDCLRDRLTCERDALQAQLKNQREERELYKSHIRSAELENTKLSAELQMLKAVELNREVTIAQYEEEIHRLHTEKNTHMHSGDATLREQLRQVEAQLQAAGQQAGLLGSELRDTTAHRDRTMGELVHARQEVDTLRAHLADARQEADALQAHLADAHKEADALRAHLADAHKEADALRAHLADDHQESQRSQEQQEQEVGGAVAGAGVASELEAELQKEVDELKLRLHMAAGHYKEKYRECQRLRRHVSKLTQQDMQQRECQKNAMPTETQELNTADTDPPEKTPDTEECADRKGEGEEEEEEEGGGKTEKNEDEEDEPSVSVEMELARMEERWREQCTINDILKLQLANEDQRFKALLAEKDRELTALHESLAEVTREKQNLSEELRSYMGMDGGSGGQRSEVREPVVLRYPVPYPQDPPPLPLVQQQPAELRYGNPYSTEHARDFPVDGADGALSPQQTCRPPPLAPPLWAGPVICSQPSRSLSPPDGLENPTEERPSGGDGEAPPICEHHQNPESNESSASFCFDTRTDVHKRCPLCEVIFPPHFEQRSFERHVESHWRECPVCSEQFPLDCQQHLYEKHVLTHFDGNVLNFDNFD
ncbi:tax1-binding protein 1 homolog A isoform X2 [Brachyhypopomus gauderio]|uniref:tax1-binding protein 1 homolog A isoform X2 n=1 Tax=Brachyhypopomus gauderio TaxID=698409 RepID=UPI004041AE06